MSPTDAIKTATLCIVMSPNDLAVERPARTAGANS
jgi:hypothetical protein